MLLPWEWWKLSYYWLTQLKSRSPKAKRGGLFRNSMRAATLGLAISVGALSVTVALVSGFQKTLSEATAQSLGHLVYYTKWRSFEDLDRLLHLGPSLHPPFKRVDFFWSSQALLVGPKGGRGVLIEGRRNALTQEKSSRFEGVLLTLGKPLAEYLGVKEGDPMRLLLPGLLRNSIEARVQKILSYGMYEIDSRLALVEDASLRSYLETNEKESFDKRPGDAHGIRIFFDLDTRGKFSEKWVEDWKMDFRREIEKASFGDKEALVKTWLEQKKNLFGAVDLDKKILTLVLSLLTLVASLNIAATLVVLFLERDREIATLQALGLSRSQLRQWITVQGLILGLISSGLGLFLGRAMGWILQRLPWAKLPEEIYNISSLPLLFIWKEQVAIFVFGVLAALLVASILGLALSRQKLLLVLGHRR